VIKSEETARANPAIASVVKITANKCPGAFYNKRYFFLCTKKHSSLLKYQRFSSKFLEKIVFFFCFLGQRPLVPLLLLGLPFFSDYSFWSTTLLTGMTGISLHMQCAMASDFSVA
jgi:hypothetical protein